MRIIHITQVVPPYCHLVITTLTGILLSRRFLYWLTIIVVLIIIDCDSGGTRTLDPSIKSAVLYLLSYEVILSKSYLFVLTGAKLRIISQTTKCFTNFFISNVILFRHIFYYNKDLDENLNFFSQIEILYHKLDMLIITFLFAYGLFEYSF